MDARSWGFVLVAVAMSVFLILFWSSFSVGVVRGMSMYPTLKSGDVIFLETGRTGEVSISAGDVIGYWPGPSYSAVAHRVVAVFPGFVLAKGDNFLTNPSVDPFPIFVSEIVGRVVCRFRLPFLT